MNKQIIGVGTAVLISFGAVTAQANTFLVDYAATTGGTAGRIVNSTAADYQAADPAVELGTPVNVIGVVGLQTFGINSVDTANANGFFNTNKGIYDNIPILDGYTYDTNTNAQNVTVTGLAAIPFGTNVTLTLYGVGDSNVALDAGTVFTPTYGVSLGTQATDYATTNTFVQYTFAADGTDSLVISWTRKGAETSGFNGFSMTYVPEPTSAALGLLGLAGFLIARRRR